jgi:hypothetical protein
MRVSTLKPEKSSRLSELSGGFGISTSIDAAKASKIKKISQIPGT